VFEYTCYCLLASFKETIVARYSASQGGPKNGPCLNVDNFAMASGRKACDMSKVCTFCLEKSVKLA